MGTLVLFGHVFSRVGIWAHAFSIRRLTSYRGCNRKACFRQFIQTKRGRFGIKAWVMAESETGYVNRLQMFTGKQLKGMIMKMGYQLVSSMTCLLHMKIKVIIFMLIISMPARPSSYLCTIDRYMRVEL
jgi:hypothetical protein